MRTPHRSRLALAASTFRSLAPAEARPDAEAASPPRQAWAGPIGFEGVTTGDGRLIEREALRWPTDLTAENPIDFRYVSEDVGFHDGAVVVGHINTLERISLEDAQARLAALGLQPMALEGDILVIWATGDIVTDSEVAEAAAAAIGDMRGRGVSMDLDAIVWEVRVRAEIVAEEDAFMEAMLNEGEDSNWTPPERREVDGYVVVEEGNPDDSIMVMIDAEIRTATGVSVPAFSEALISIVEAGDQIDPEEQEDAEREEAAPTEDAAATDDDEEALVAAAAPVAPPAAWFANPQLDGPTPLTITEDGRVFGHAATFDQCHVASPAGEGICVLAPRSRMNYAKFHLGSLLTDDGESISVGKITMGTGHAAARLRTAAATEHYDNTGTAVADVRAGEDRFGIWLAGSLRPDVTDEQVRALRASPISGDWRKVDGNLELVAALAVNVPGFPVIPRPSGLVASGELMSLVATGIVLEEPVVEDARVDDRISDSELAALRRLAARELERENLAARTRVTTFANKQRVAAFAAARA
ncbi:capsid maturation protease [Microbacterium phage FuzzBuster]|uniref:Capsid maturation protease n=1 Tax=Microbacterium phage FuzzBuster TaxID=2590935 RepID=A0A516KV08_9CAUD|nr:capsid maturation protease [Microbacterium phage FuzzBuster]